MDILGWITDAASSLPLALVYTLGGLFSFLESGLGLGFFLPGETIVLLLSATFDEAWKVVPYLALVAIGASAGDHVGYLLGRRFGRGLRDTRLIARLGTGNWDRAVGVLEKRGAWAVLLTRMVPVVRTLTPAAAGVAGVGYRPFVAASLSGAVLWSALYVGVGYLLRSSLDAVQHYLGNAGWILAGAAVVVVTLVVVVRALRRRRRGAVDDPVRVIGAGADLVLPEPPEQTRPATRTVVVEAFQGRTGAIAVFAVRASTVLAAAVIAANQHFFVAALLLLATLLSKPLQTLLRPEGSRRSPRDRALWTEPTLDRITASLVGLGLWAGHALPWEGLALLVLPEVLLGIATVLAFRGLVGLPVTRAERVRSFFQLIGLTAVCLGFAGRLALPIVVAPVTVILVGYLTLFVGIVASYVVAARFSRAMLARWQMSLARR
ncbi:DedA family protein [Frondihabitans cladoniiphilus]|uniref:VTT domain-containing protein n=1 Tax=Frondihabitans cladoniiphilus TaxID=715785 RepID=A0ABP8WDS0_9MICO